MEQNNISQVNPQIPTQPPSALITEPEKKKFVNPKWAVLGMVILLLMVTAAGAAYFYLNSNKKVACTQEAKLCPDGKTYVSRTGPNCEFAKCPVPSVIPDETSNWKTYNNSIYKYSFKYPPELHIGQNSLAKESPILSRSSSVLEPTTDDEFEAVGYNIDVTTTQTNLDLKGLENQFDKSQLSTRKEYSIKPISVDGVDGFRINSCRLDFPADCVALLKNGSEYRISIIYYSSDSKLKNEGKKYFDQILSTFKFTDQTPTPTCVPRPKCLDEYPRCLIPETEDMCPPTVTPSQ